MEKKERTIALSNFTRNLNSLNTMITNSAQTSIVVEQFNKFKGCWDKLEAAHDAFISVTDIDIETDKDGLSYIDAPNDKFNAAVQYYSDFLKTANDNEQLQSRANENATREAEVETRKQLEATVKDEEERVRLEHLKEKFISTETGLSTSIDSFNRMIVSVTNSLDDASVSYKQKEWTRAEKEFEKLRTELSKLAGIDFRQDMTAINKTFLDKADTPFIALQKLMIVQLKDAPVLQKPVETVAPPKHSNTKQESVGLPEFKGEEKGKELSPYLKYPVWRKQWDVLILGYDEDWRSSILNQKLDDAARNTFVGYENDYNEAMKRLDKFYGNTSKVVECVMKEVCSPREIVEGDYKGLLAYTTILENNFNRLRSLNHEHELSNTMSMSSILRKFPRTISEKWIEFLSGLSSSEATRPFPNFIAWLSSQRTIWEGMVVVDQKFNSKSSSSFFGDGNSNDNNGSGGSGGGGPKCFQCGEEGHKRYQCPKSQKGEKKPPEEHLNIKSFGVLSTRTIRRDVVIR